jgi:hypothetical protein
LNYQFIFETFHGGSSERWAPTNPDGSFATVHALFDNFEVYEGLNIRETPGMGDTPPVPVLLPSPADQPRLCVNCPEAEGAYTVNGRFLSPEFHRFLLIRRVQPRLPDEKF